MIEKQNDNLVKGAVSTTMLCSPLFLFTFKFELISLGLDTIRLPLTKPNEMSSNSYMTLLKI